MEQPFGSHFEMHALKSVRHDLPELQDDDNLQMDCDLKTNKNNDVSKEVTIFSTILELKGSDLGECNLLRLDIFRVGKNEQ